MKGSGGKIGNRIEKLTGLDCPERKVVSFELTMKKKKKHEGLCMFRCIPTVTGEKVQSGFATLNV